MLCPKRHALLCVHILKKEYNLKLEFGQLLHI